ncbi:MAG: site-specific integrase [Clostridiales bacterium]|nr:site-specific integrase [Clostridiales bacterium]
MNTTPERYYISSNKFSTHERQTKRGRVYDIVFRIVTMEGVEKQKKLSGFKTKGDAKQAYLDFVQEYCELAKRKAVRKPVEVDATSEQTVADVVPLYLAALGNQNKDSSIYDKKNNYNKYIIPQLGSEPIKNLTRERLYRWQDELWSMRNPKTNQYYSHAYLTKIRTSLSALLTWLSDRYGIENNLSKLRKPRRRTPKTKMKFWTVEEFNQFIATVDNPVYRTFFSMMFYTGRRKGEIIALQADDVSESTILFDKTYSRKTLDDTPYSITSTKNEQRDYSQICAPLKQALAEYTPQSPFYFGGDHPIHENTIAHAFDRYVAKSGVKQIRVYDLRHSFVSMCVHLGANIFVIADLINDTPEQVLKTYGHLYAADKQAIIDKIK